MLLTFTLLGGSAQSGMPPAGGAAAVICTSHGMITLGEDGKPLAPKGGWGHLCAFCLPMLHGGATMPGPVALPRPTTYQDSPLFAVSADPAPLPPGRMTEAHPRAPPALA